MPAFVLTADEVSMLRWASEQAAEAGSFRARFRSSAAAQLVYRKATGFEALLGFLQLTDPARLLALIDVLVAHSKQSS
jgi:23S rRNA maturation mini-RNase III